MPIRESPYSNGEGSPFDLLAFNNSDASYFIRHIGLRGPEDETDSAKSPPSMYHMSPPIMLEEIEDLEPDHSFFADLEISHIRKLETFIASHKLQVDAAKRRPRGGTDWDEYIVLPHWQRSGDDGPTFRRYSCAGFVFEAYKWAEITLVKADELPDVDYHIVSPIYLRGKSKESTKRIRSEYGLSGEGPWKILLPGYIVHSFLRDSPSIISGPLMANIEMASYCAPTAAEE